MKRSALWLWCSAGLVGVALVVVFGGWWAVRQWPGKVGPHLSPSLAIRLAGMGKAEFEAATYSIMNHPDHPLSAARIAAWNAVLYDALRGPPSDQLVALRLIVNESEPGSLPASPERDALVFACTTSADPEVRASARYRWTEGAFGPTRFLRRTATKIGDNDRSPLSPDHWVAGRAAWIAWRMKVFTNQGNDHVTPNKYAKHLRAQLELLLACDDGQGRFSPDERDQAIVVAVLADLLGMTNDKSLKPVVERAASVIGGNRARLERLWQEDTTTACLTATCSLALTGAGVPVEHLREPLRAGFAAWWASRTKDAPPLWYAHNVVVEATVTERWGAAIASEFWSAAYDDGVASAAPPTLLDDLAPCSPFGRYLVMLGAVVHTDPRWENSYKERQRFLDDTMIITPNHIGPEGAWPAQGDVSTEWETVFSALELTMSWPRSYLPPPP